MLSNRRATHLYGAGNFVEQTPKSSPRVNVEVTHDPTICKSVIDAMILALMAGPKTRPRSLAVTKLEEARMWLDEALRLE